MRGRRCAAGMQVTVPGHSAGSRALQKRQEKPFSLTDVMTGQGTPPDLHARGVSRVVLVPADI